MLSQLEAIDYQVMHAVPGRVRIKILALRQDVGYANRLEQSVRNLPEVREVRINSASASMTVSYSNKANSTEQFPQDIQNQLIELIQQASSSVSPSASTHNGISPSASTPSSPVAIAAPITTPLQAVLTASPFHQNLPVAAKVPHAADHESPIASRIKVNIPHLLTLLEVSLPQEADYEFDYFPFEIYQKNKQARLGIPAKLLLDIINSEIDKFKTESERNTNTEQIHLDVDLSLVERGLFLRGNAKGKFRKKLFTGPITKHKHYTPWAGMSAFGETELSLSIADEVLHISMKDLKVFSNSGEWKERLISYSFDHLIKDRLMRKINKVLSNYSGKKLQHLFFQTPSGQDFLSKIEPMGLTQEPINALLELFEIHVNLTVDYLWLSIQL